ncbi:MAG: cellulose synthase/poly-beta-1,6-N-acetylglucosamine synthase-like glycosyltransferase [Paracoccaceae bacterium]|jgi:cellulose synthase/poly-beta-1,6-N-acetylglucosamine synthase-like glycosyltransferase
MSAQIQRELRIPAAPPLRDGNVHLLKPASKRSEQSRPGKLLGQRLIEAGVLHPSDLVKALALQARQDARLGDILLTNGLVGEAALMQVLCEQWRTERLNLEARPPDPRLVDTYSPAACLRDGLVPWRRVGSITVVATARPEHFADQRSALEAIFGPVAMALCTHRDLSDAVEMIRSKALMKQAESRVEAQYSCRNWSTGRSQAYLFAGLSGLFVLSFLAPLVVFAVLCVWACLTLVINMLVKVFATFHALRSGIGRRVGPFTSTRRPTLAIARLPVVSVMIPLFKEQNITGKLVNRLSRLAYPKELLDICLVVEATDTQTREVLSRTDLPMWMRVVTVPKGGVQTKPRALNYALDFCRGSIIGVWDAEDAPAPDQLHKVVRRFHERGPDLACVQGQLDFYNARSNWLSRCFTIEYATWFRILLPGLERLGFAIPLGGTTLFFRRTALESLGGWDAHNVTEDADLGIRLARMGYRTEMVASVTEEEANCHPLAWVKQRSRWLKGYAMTWAVHMRNPAQLWRDLGPWKFFGVQIVFLCTLSQFLLAPLLWSFWLVAFGLWHPLSDILPVWAFWALGGIFLTSEVLNITIGCLAVNTRGRRFLIPWVPSLHLYFPLGALASYKAVYELLVSPFYWDKTSHGLYDEHEAGTLVQPVICASESSFSR